MRRIARVSAWPLVGAHVAVGGALGVLLLHPATMVIYWLEHAPDTAGLGPAWRFAFDSFNSTLPDSDQLRLGVQLRF